MAATLEELSFHRNSEEQDYNKYLAYLEKKASEKKQQTSSKGSEVKSSPSSTPNLSSASLKNSSTPEINQKRAAEKKSSKKGTHTIDDFVPNETIDSGFLGEPEKEVGKTFENSDDEEDDSDSDNQGNPMVSGFQDIISSDEDQKEEPGTSFVQNTNADVDVDIEITSDESEEEVQPTPVSRERDLIDGGEKQMSLLSTKPKASGTTNEIGLNEEDSSFMDAWLDSPNTNPPDQKKSVGKSGADVPESTDLFGHNKLDVFEASKLTIMTSSVDPADGEEENSSENVNEEKKKRHSERKNKEEEESKHKHRSKHKHKKKTKTKDSEDDESTEKKSKSKRKHRHKHSKSREKKDNNENGADYESF